MLILLPVSLPAAPGSSPPQPLCAEWRIGYGIHAARINDGEFTHAANRYGDQTMKRNASRSHKLPKLPITWTWRDAEYAALRADAADSCDDRVSENFFNSEDERAEVDIIVHGMMRDAN